MPDISMCQNEACPSRKYCYRFMAEPNSRQTYATFACREGESKCDSFMEIWNKKGL